MAETFKTTILQAEGLNATGISVPPKVIAALGSNKRPKVVITVNGYTYRSTVAPFGDVFMLPLSQEHRHAAGLKAGDEVEVTLELDTEPRTVEVPEDLHAALSEKAGALETFEGLAYSKRKEFVRQVNEARAEETRKRRISNIVAQVGEGK
jgi:bifunctional DNA-binding transcriptional regulator/antitoxin component of YhaV-PrlF toxin-antitoxin module